MQIPFVGASGIEPVAAAIAIIAFIGMRRYHWSMVYVMSGSALAGLGRWILLAAVA